MAVRKAIASDVPLIKGIIDANELFPSDMIDDMTQGYFASTTDDRWIVAASDGAVDGVAYYKPEMMTSGTWNCLLLAVHPEKHNKGIGRALMSHIEENLKSEGHRVLIVETSGLPTFEKTRSFYANKCGYEEEARIRDYYDAGEDKIVYRKAL